MNVNETIILATDALSRFFLEFPDQLNDFLKISSFEDFHNFCLRNWDDKKLQENAVEHLFELYVKISTESEINETLESQFREAFKQLSQGDTQMKDIWKKFTQSSIETMNMQLSRIFVKPKYNI